MKTLFSFVLVFCFAAVVPAQERVMDKAEFDTLVTEGHNHRLKWKDEKYRMTVTTSSKVTGRPQTDFSSKMILEFGSSMETRTINSSVFGDKRTPGRESLRIGKWLYTRSGSDAWTRKEYTPSEAASKEREEIPYQTLSSQADYRYFGEGKLMDKPVSIYVKTERGTKVNQKTGETSESESKNTYWVDANGMILKSDFAAESRGKIIIRNTVIMEWELDPSIKFTAPEIVP